MLDKLEMLKKMFNEHDDFKLHFMKSKTIPGWKSWKKYSECTDAERNESNLRSLFDDEKILDLDEPERLKEITIKLDQEKYSYELWKTGSKGYHFSLIFPELKKLPEEKRKKLRSEFIKSFNCDDSKKTGLLALENTPHFKTGRLKELLSKKDNGPNILHELEILEIKEPIISNNSSTIPSDVDAWTKNDPILDYLLNTPKEKMKKDIQKNTIVFKNMAVMLAQLPEKNKNIYVTQISENTGHPINELNGWITKVLRGEISEYNKNELNIWIMDNDLSIKQYDVEKSTKEKFEPQYITSHLRNFDELRTITKLHGNYDFMVKALWYGIYSAIAQKKVVNVGDIQTDMRFHNIFVLPTGQGKQNLIITQEKILTGIGKSVVRPTSYHPQGLIGKVKVTTSKKKDALPVYTKIFGSLNENIMILNEALELVQSEEQNNKESRAFLTQAMDTYQTNKIVKGSVDIPQEYRLEYYPDCIISMFFQPVQIPESTFLQGFMRRPQIIFSKNLHNNEQDFDNRLYAIGKEQYAAKLELFINKLKESEDVIYDTEQPRETLVNFTDKAIDKLSELHKILLCFGEIHSEKARNYMNMIQWSSQDVLVKMASILCVSQNRSEVTEYDIECAFADYMETLWSTFNYIDSRVMGFLNYGFGIGGAKGKENQFVKILYQKGAFSEEDSFVSIADGNTLMKEIFGIQENQARKKLSKLEKNEIICKKQIGSTDSKLWLHPKMKKDLDEFFMGGKGGKGGLLVTTYLNIINKIQLYKKTISKENKNLVGIPIISKNFTNNNSKEQLILYSIGESTTLTTHDTHLQLTLPENTDKLMGGNVDYHPQYHPQVNSKLVNYREMIIDLVQEIKSIEWVLDKFEDHDTAQKLIDKLLEENLIFEPNPGFIKKL